jgi:hypothetical protein
MMICPSGRRSAPPQLIVREVGSWPGHRAGLRADRYELLAGDCDLVTAAEQIVAEDEANRGLRVSGVAVVVAQPPAGAVSRFLVTTSAQVADHEPDPAANSASARG